MPKRFGAPVCHPDRPYWAKGLCKSCYTNQWAKKNAQADPDQRQRHIERYQIKARLLARVGGLRLKDTSMARVFGDAELVKRLHKRHKASDPLVMELWPLLTTKQKATINYGQPIQ